MITKATKPGGILAGLLECTKGAVLPAIELGELIPTAPLVTSGIINLSAETLDHSHKKNLEGVNEATNNPEKKHTQYAEDSHLIDETKKIICEPSQGEPNHSCLPIKDSPILPEEKSTAVQGETTSINTAANHPKEQGAKVAPSSVPDPTCIDKNVELDLQHTKEKSLVTTEENQGHQTHTIQGPTRCNVHGEADNSQCGGSDHIVLSTGVVSLVDETQTRIDTDGTYNNDFCAAEYIEVACQPNPEEVVEPVHPGVKTSYFIRAQLVKHVGTLACSKNITDFKVDGITTDNATACGKTKVAVVKDNTIVTKTKSSCTPSVIGPSCKAPETPESH